MLTKFEPLLRAAQHVKQICRKSHDVPAHWKSMRQVCEENKSHMNCLPVPEGCWQADFNKKNAKRNVALIASIISLVFTAGVMCSSGVFYLHLSPPMYNCKK